MQIKIPLKQWTFSRKIPKHYFLRFLILRDFFRSFITLYKMRYYFCELFYHLSVKNLQEKSSLPSYATSTRTNSLLAKVLTIASSFFVPFVAELQWFIENFAPNRESLNWTSGSVFWIKNRVSLCFYRTQVLTIEKFIKR